MYDFPNPNMLTNQTAVIKKRNWCWNKQRVRNIPLHDFFVLTYWWCNLCSWRYMWQQSCYFTQKWFTLMAYWVNDNLDPVKLTAVSDCLIVTPLKLTYFSNVDTPTFGCSPKTQNCVGVSIVWTALITVSHVTLDSSILAERNRQLVATT